MKNYINSDELNVKIIKAIAKAQESMADENISVEDKYIYSAMISSLEWVQNTIKAMATTNGVDMNLYENTLKSLASELEAFKKEAAALTNNIRTIKAYCQEIIGTEE